jgi:hypothetical protein
MDEPASLAIANSDVRLNSFVAHRQQFNAEIPAFGKCGSHICQRISRVEHFRSNQVDGQIAIAKPEPTRTDPKGGEFGSGVETLALASPAGFLVDYPAQGVHDGVQIGADSEPKEGCVIAGVGHDGDPGIRRDRAEASEKSGPANSAREANNSLHAEYPSAIRRIPTLVGEMSDFYESSVPWVDLGE